MLRNQVMDIDKSSNWGGSRPGAGNKFKWNNGETKAVRIPIAIADQVLAVAKEIDSGKPTNNDCVTQSLVDIEKLLATNQEYSLEIGKLKAELTELSHQLQRVTDERDNYFDQITDIKLELDNLKDDSVTQSNPSGDNVTQSRLPGDILNQLRQRDKKSKATIKDIEAILDLISE